MQVILLSCDEKIQSTTATRQQSELDMNASVELKKDYSLYRKLNRVREHSYVFKDTNNLLNRTHLRNCKIQRDSIPRKVSTPDVSNIYIIYT